MSLDDLENKFQHQVSTTPSHQQSREDSLVQDIKKLEKSLETLKKQQEKELNELNQQLSNYKNQFSSSHPSHHPSHPPSHPSHPPSSLTPTPKVTPTDSSISSPELFSPELKGYEKILSPEQKPRVSLVAEKIKAIEDRSKSPPNLTSGSLSPPNSPLLPPTKSTTSTPMPLTPFRLPKNSKANWTQEKDELSRHIEDLRSTNEDLTAKYDALCIQNTLYKEELSQNKIELNRLEVEYKSIKMSNITLESEIKILTEEPNSTVIYFFIYINFL